MRKKSLVKNAANQEQVKRAETSERLLSDRETNDLRFIVNTPQGRRFLWRRLEDCGLLARCAHNSGSWTYFNEGARSVGVELMKEIIEADSDAYLLMIKECQIGELNV